jgi:uncharacterized membrane protein
LIEDFVSGLNCDDKVLVSFICGFVAAVVIALFLNYVSKHL